MSVEPFLLGRITYRTSNLAVDLLPAFKAYGQVRDEHDVPWGGGRQYFFNNTLLQQPGSTYRNGSDPQQSDLGVWSGRFRRRQEPGPARDVVVQQHPTPDAIEELLESTGRPIVDSRNGFTTPRLDLFAAVMKLRLNVNLPMRRRAVRH